MLSSLGYCPLTAPLDNCSNTSKRGLTTRRKTAGIAAQPRPAAVPVNMRSLKALRKSKVAARQAHEDETLEPVKEEKM